MAWRPSEYLIEGELDNTTPGKVTGWMQFASMKEKVTFDLNGDFHRDIRGARVRLRGAGRGDSSEAAKYLEGLVLEQTGDVGDMTAGLPPKDYVGYPYFEWYGHENGRVVVELDSEQIEIIGRPIPACESDPISRGEQGRNMANFLAGISQEAGVPAIAPGQQLVSDPSFTHWVVAEGRIIGEAREVRPAQNGACFAHVRLFNMPESAEHGRIQPEHLREKDPRRSANAASAGTQAAEGGES